MPDANKQGRGYRVYRKDEDKLKVYRHRVSVASESLKKLELQKFYDRYELLPRPEEHTPAGHRITVTSGISVVDSMYAALTSVDVDFEVTNLGHGSRPQAMLAQAGIKEVWRESEGAEAAEDAIKDSLVIGIGWVKVGYDYAEAEREVPRTEQEVLDELDILFESAMEAGMPPPAPDEVAQLVPATKVVKEAVRDRIVIDYVPWDDMLWDPTAKRIEDVRWYCQVTRLPVEEVRANPVFREYVKKRRGGLRDLEDLKPDADVTRELLGDDRKDKSVDDDMRVTVYEMWDLETGTICTFTKNGKFLLNEQPNPLSIFDDFKEKSPFVPMVLRKSSRRVVGISDMAIAIPTVDEQEVYRSQLATYLERFGPKVIGPGRGMTEAGKEALQSPEYGAFVELEEGTSSQEFDVMNPPALPQEVFGMEQRLKDDLRESTGLNEVLRGLFPQGRQTATETAEVVQAGTTRQSEKRNRLERFYKDIGQRILVFMQLMYDTPRVSRLVTDIGDVVWEWSAEDISTEAGLEIHLSPKESKTARARRDDALGLANLLGQVPEIDRTALMRWTLEEYGLPQTVIREFLKQPQEVAEEQAEQSAQQVEQVAAEEAVRAEAQAGGPTPEAAMGAAELGAQGDIPPEMAAYLGGSPVVGP